MYDLSLALGEKALQQAEKIKHPHRATSIIYHLAQVYSILGENQKALLRYEAVLEYVQKFRQISGIDWYIVPALLGKAKIQMELSEFDSALLVCNEVERHDLKIMNEIRLQMLRWDINRSLGNYEKAEKELDRAKELSEAAKDTSYIIRCLNNFGFMFSQMSEYDRALDYYQQARSLFRSSLPDNSMRMLIFNNTASVLAAKNDFVRFEEVTREARSLLNSTNIPFEEAKSLHIFGYRYKDIKKYDDAIKYLQKADSIYSRTGFLRFALQTKSDLVDCYIGLSRLDEAEALIVETASLAKESDNIEGMIESMAQRAHIQYRRGHLEQAVKSSNQVLFTVDTMLGRFTNPDRLRVYRHKIYDYFKNAVLYEIALQRYDSAFIKLDRAKAFISMNQLLNDQANHFNSSALAHNVDLDSMRTRLNEQSSLLHYMVMDDTLYAFLLNRSDLHFFSKPLDKKALQAKVAAYRDSILQTINVFRRYNPARVNSHYAGTVHLSEQIYQELFEWPELKALIEKSAVLYIVPDEFLYHAPFATLTRKSADGRATFSTGTAVTMLPNAAFLLNGNRVHIADRFKTKRALISIDSTFKGTEQIVKNIKRIFPVAEELMMNAKAFTKNDVLMKLQENYQVYIFLGHGAANPNYPQLSYIELTVKMPNTPTTKRIRLTLEDLNQINWLDAEMVMLVGCETAAGKLYRGTGIHGLYQGFLSLGAQHVLGSLWRADADKTIAQAENFLSVWAANSNPAQALLDAQRRTMEELTNSVYYRHPHPYFWGSLILFSNQSQ
jgi:CHAT domain-containing protein